MLLLRIRGIVGTFLIPSLFHATAIVRVLRPRSSDCTIADHGNSIVRADQRSEGERRESRWVRVINEERKIGESIGVVSSSIPI
jgi:hypothetical protein